MMNINYDFSNEEEYSALEDMLDSLSSEEISAIHKTVEEVRSMSLEKRRQEVFQRFERCILPVLIDWARSAHATLEVKEEQSLFFVASLTSVYGFSINRDKWKRSLLAVADEISIEVFDNSVLMELLFNLGIE